LVRVLAVKVDQKLADRLELGQRRRTTVDLCPASPLGVEHAAQEEWSVVREIVLDQPCSRCGRVVQIELCRDFRAIRAEPELSSLEAIAEQERKRIQQQRFACTGFAGQYGEAVIELDVERGDDSEVSDG
jgi:hypothetical protein